MTSDPPLWQQLQRERAGEARQLRQLWRADFAASAKAFGGRERSALASALNVLSLPGFQAAVLFRLAAALHSIGLLPLARVVSWINFTLFTTEISPRAVIGPGLVLAHPQGVLLGAGVVIGRNVRLMRGVALGIAGRRDPAKDGFPVIGDDCVLFHDVLVVGPIQVGAGSIIGAGVRLFQSVPPGSVVSTRPELQIRTPEQQPATPAG